MPSKDSGYTMSSKSNCTNGVTITWDDEEWMAKVYYKNYQKEKNSRVKCYLYFEEKIIPPSPSDAVKEYILAKALEGTILEEDGTEDHNMRYIGVNPRNYVYFNCDDNSNPTAETCELWRIIGVMNNIDDGTGNKETRIKLIRNESIGSYSWDTSDSAINNGYGVNEWSQADVMKLLNPGYDDESVGGSLYWNRTAGTCYNGANNGSSSCDFSNIGLSSEAKLLIGEAIWNTGSVEKKTSWSASDGLSSHFYKYERSSNVGDACRDMCANCRGCNDTIKRNITWTGYVGLMYSSDYGYATSGGTTCSNSALPNWTKEGKTICYNNDWLYKSGFIQWTMTPASYTNAAYYGVTIQNNGWVRTEATMNVPNYIFPTLYLKSNVQIMGGEGTQIEPFVIALSE